MAKRLKHFGRQTNTSPTLRRRRSYRHTHHDATRRRLFVCDDLSFPAYTSRRDSPATICLRRFVYPGIHITTRLAGDYLSATISLSRHTHQDATRRRLFVCDDLSIPAYTSRRDSPATICLQRFVYPGIHITTRHAGDYLSATICLFRHNVTTRLFVCDNLSLISNMFDILRRDKVWIKTALKKSVATNRCRRVEDTKTQSRRDVYAEEKRRTLTEGC